VGQQHIAQALKNAIQSERVAHAYLFSGARGVGKTSMARILAKALNCPDAKDGNPCNTCEICNAISAGHDVDIQEIDGASNRGIDDIRSLRSNVNVMSMRTRFKIYIIDEVHMLTKEAFNALLKTLEEPPPNVKFIFCTTEPNKLPDTVLSRCQRFDFSTIETMEISDRLSQIATTEGYEVEEEALELVARRANGSMRDGQSLFDQLLAFGERKITKSDVHRLLGTADEESILKIVKELQSENQHDALRLFDEALTEGAQVGELLSQIIAVFRDLMIVSSKADEVSLISVSQNRRSDLELLAQQWGLSTILAGLEILSSAKDRIFRSTAARTLAEMALVRISLLGNLSQVDELLSQLKNQPSGSIATISAASSLQAPLKSSHEKKNKAAKKPVTSNQPAESIHASRIDFSQGNEQELLSQLVSGIKDALKIHLNHLNHIAISGPNQLDFVFPTSYHFGRRICEQPENVRQLEEIVERLCRKSVRIRMLTSSETEGPTDHTNHEDERPVLPGVSARSQEIKPEELDDPFVQQTLSLFGGSVLKIEEIEVESKED